MRLGIVLFASDRGITPAAAAAAAEARGFDSFYLPEHTHIPVRREAAHPRTGDATLPDDRYQRTLDPWVSLGTAVPLTSRITLGTAVALPVEHDPITLAKTLATLDHLSGGRVVLGVGFGWNTDELTDHGVNPARRRTTLREYLEAMQTLWSADESGYTSESISFGPSWAYPKPVQRPRIPILLGAAGTDKNFRWLARSADGWITTPGEEEIDSRVQRLHEIWQESGRSDAPQTVVLAGKPNAEQLSRWRDLGVTEVIFGLPDRSEAEVEAYLDRLAGKVLTPNP